MLLYVTNIVYLDKSRKKHTSHACAARTVGVARPSTWLGTVSLSNREARDWRDRRDPKFDVQGSQFRKLRTSDLEPSSISPVSPFPLVALRSRRALARKMNRIPSDSNHNQIGFNSGLIAEAL